MSSISDSEDVPAAQTLPAHAAATVGRRRLALLLPVAMFAGIAAVFAVLLDRDPSVLPSVLIGKPVPEFSLPPVQGRTLGLSSTNLKDEVSLVNVFASWCTACRDEHPLFMEIKAPGSGRNPRVPTIGLRILDNPSPGTQSMPGRRSVKHGQRLLEGSHRFGVLPRMVKLFALPAKLVKLGRVYIR